MCHFNWVDSINIKFCRLTGHTNFRQKKKTFFK